jgi:MFS family permease
MFVFVFYFQGAQGDTPIVAGIKLAPLALGMLVSSPLAGVWADRRGSSRTMAAVGMLVTGAGLALMTLLQRDTSYLPVGIYLFIVGVGSGMFNSPNTAAMMGVVPPHRRGIAAGARVLVQNTGAVISIAFVLAIITSSVPKMVLFRVFSGLSHHLSNHQLAPFIGNMHTALWCLAAVSLLGAVVSAARPSHEAELDLGPAPAMEGATPAPAEAPANEAAASEAAANEAAVI